MSTGIYIIQSIKHPGRQYVGSCVDFNLRWLVHKGTLLNKKHHNSILQNHVDKYGLDDLLFLKVEECEREQLLTREQYYIDTLKPFFNINPIAGSRLNSKHSDQTKLKLIAAGKSGILRKRLDFRTGRIVKS